MDLLGADEKNPPSTEIALAQADLVVDVERKAMRKSA